MADEQQRESRIPGWHRLSRLERVRFLADRLACDPTDVMGAVEHGGLAPDAAEQLVEDVIGTYALPYAIAPNFRINDRDVLVPMVVEEASVVAASSNAARMIREGGGFRVRVDDPLMICQVQVFARDLEQARDRILAARSSLLEKAASVDPTLSAIGGGPVDIEVRIVRGTDPDDAFLVVHVVADVRDAMGANAVNSMGEAVAPDLESITGGRTGLRILTNLADRRLVHVAASVPVAVLQMPGYSGEQVCDGIVSASRFAELDPYRAATHNKGVMNGTDAVIIATGNDWRAVEAGAHAFAVRDGRYGPLCIWRRVGKNLEGRLTMPMAVGTVGGATRVHPGARLALQVMEAKGASDVAAVAAAAGMANNLAALRALSTEGIQRGHMRLHARSRSLVR